MPTTPPPKNSDVSAGEVLSDRDRRFVTAALLLGIFLTALDVLVVAPAMPNVVAELGGLGLYPWVFSAYLLTATVTTPIYGRLADVYGRKRLYLVGLVLFVGGSALCGAAPSMGVLVAMRAVQGLGAGALVPVTLTLVGDLYRLEGRARMQGVFSSVWGVASVIGPPVGGTLVEHAGWRWVFYLNIPFGLAAWWLIKRYLSEPSREAEQRELDVPAALALMLGLAGILYALQQPGGGTGGSSLNALVPAGVGLALLVGFVVRERGVAEPLVDPALFRDRIFLAANAGGFLAFGALYSATAYVPLLVRGVFGDSAQAAGMALMPLSLGWVVGSNISGRLLLRVGYRVTVGLGVANIAAGCGGLAVLQAGSGAAHLYVAMAGLGLGMGLAMTGFIVAVQGAAPAARLGIATSSVHFFRSLGGAVGVAILGAVMLGALREQGIDPSSVSPLAKGSPGSGAPVPPQTLMVALHPVFVASFLFGLGTLIAGLAMPGGRAQAHVHESHGSEP